MMPAPILYSATGNLLWVLEADGLTDATLVDFQHFCTTLCRDQKADGVMLMNPETFRLWILNADGSNGEFCGNGLRAAAFHLQETRGLRTATLSMAEHQAIEATMHNEMVSIRLNIGTPFISTQMIKGITAYRLAVPNPHFIVLNPPPTWHLEKEGAALSHEYDTNVEWVYPEKAHFQVLVYERGVGPTKACGSGAMATFKVLQSLGHVTDSACIRMPGGDLTVDETHATLCVSGAVKKITILEEHYALKTSS